MKNTLLCLDERRCVEFLRLDARLALIVYAGMDEWPHQHMLVSSIHRTQQEENAAGGKSGIHMAGPPYRALDGSARNFVAASDEERWAMCERVAAAVSARWIYDPARPTMVVAFAQVHGSGPHVHFQVHAGTLAK